MRNFCRFTWHAIEISRQIEALTKRTIDNQMGCESQPEVSGDQESAAIPRERKRRNDSVVEPCSAKRSKIEASGADPSSGDSPRPNYFGDVGEQLTHCLPENFVDASELLSNSLRRDTHCDLAVDELDRMNAQYRHYNDSAREERLAYDEAYNAKLQEEKNLKTFCALKRSEVKNTSRSQF